MRWLGDCGNCSRSFSGQRSPLLSGADVEDYNPSGAGVAVFGSVSVDVGKAVQEQTTLKPLGVYACNGPSVMQEDAYL